MSVAGKGKIVLLVREKCDAEKWWEKNAGNKKERRERQEEEKEFQSLKVPILQEDSIYFCIGYSMGWIGKLFGGELLFSTETQGGKDEKRRKIKKEKIWKNKAEEERKIWKKDTLCFGHSSIALLFSFTLEVTPFLVYCHHHDSLNGKRGRESEREREGERSV